MNYITGYFFFISCFVIISAVFYMYIIKLFMRYDNYSVVPYKTLFWIFEMYPSKNVYSRILFIWTNETTFKNSVPKKINQKLKCLDISNPTVQMCLPGYHLIHDLLDVWRIIEGQQNVWGKFRDTKQTNVHVHCVLGCLVKLGDILLSQNIVCTVASG